MKAAESKAALPGLGERALGQNDPARADISAEQWCGLPGDSTAPREKVKSYERRVRK
jgi:hypothetical protein